MISKSIRGRCTALGLAAVLGLGTVPLRAQDRDSVYAALFQSERHERLFDYGQRASPQPARGWSSPFQFEPRVSRRESPRTHRIKTAKPVPADKSKADKLKEVAKPAHMPSNPQLALMTDPTLRAGDIVMFPEGPRVFQGDPGAHHAASDFVPFSKTEGLAAKDRKYLMALRSGVNDSWTDISDSSKTAQNMRDVETTGSVSKRRSRR